MLTLFGVTLHAQIGGRYTYQFLNLVASPRQAALGGRVVTTYDYDPSSALFNPANINYEMDNQLAVNFSNYLGDVNYGTASYAYMLDRRTQVIHAGVTYINYGNFDGYDELGNSTGDFSGGEAAVSVGYARRIGTTDLYAGGNLKLISSSLESYSSLGAAMDIGLTYVWEKQDAVMALVVRNAGAQITTYDAVREPLPLEVTLGFSQKPAKIPLRWHLTLENLQKWDIAFRNTNQDQVDLEGNVTGNDPGFFNNALRHVVIGAELFPEGGFNIRLGYSFRRGEELRIENQRAFAGISGGFSIKFNKLRLNYSYAQYNRAGSSSFFGLNLDLN
ncbi:type IX secretion system protein PorQ [Gangjinia marincola]|uniref:Type IX secretion system protein PorQ n=2 Tax=Gangjinia marincola TaxID=578463 RepID=A0ABP3XYX4_9FLAO